MDWFLSISTLLVNSALGWTKGRWWMWLLHAVNAAVWIAYAVAIEQHGLILLSFATIGIDLVSGFRSYRKK